MSYINPAAISLKDGPSNDAFGKLRVSNPVSLFATIAEYDALTAQHWDTVLSGTGAVTHLPNESSVQLSTGGTLNGAEAVYQTRAYHRYQPGKSQRISMTFLFGVAVANVRRRVGYYDAANGLFLEQTAAGVSIVQRSSTSGSPVDTAVAQTAWNIDKMDGVGPSGKTIDWTKTQILAIDFQWLGVGRVRIGFVIDGVLSYVHQILNANSLTTTYMTTPNLPLRLAVTNTAATAGTNTMKSICSSVESEGGSDLGIALPGAVARRTSFAAVTTSGLNIIAIRPKLTFGGKTNRGQVHLRDISVVANSGDIVWYLVYGDTSTVAGGSWSDVGANSLVEANTAPTGATAGVHNIATGYVGGTGSATTQSVHELDHRLPACLGANGTTQWGFWVVAYSLAGSVNFQAGLSWDEFR